MDAGKLRDFMRCECPPEMSPMIVEYPLPLFGRLWFFAGASQHNAGATKKKKKTSKITVSKIMARNLFYLNIYQDMTTFMQTPGGD